MIARLAGALLALAAVPVAAPAAEADSARVRGVLAAEDTLRVPADFEMSPLAIRAARLGIGEIVERCIAREREMSARVESWEGTVVTRATFTVGDPASPDARRMVRETVVREFHRKPDAVRTVVLKDDAYRLEQGERKPWDLEDGEEAVRIDVSDLNALPFYLDDRDAYDFRILERRILEDRVLYRVHLTPRSDFEIAPSGTIWVDTSTFSIVHEEFEFDDRVPLPLILSRVGPFVRERELVDGFWRWKRLRIHVELHGGRFRWLDGDVPDVADFTVEFRDQRVNRPWSEAPDPARGAAP